MRRWPKRQPGNFQLQRSSSFVEHKRKDTTVPVPVILTRLKTCINSRDLIRGRQVHADATRSGVELHIKVGSSLVNMYSKCGSLVEARNVFERMQHRDVICWNSLLMAYVDNGEGKVAVNLFSRMQTDQLCPPNGLTYVAVFKACIALAGSEQGVMVDGKLVKVNALQTGMALHSQARSQASNLCSDVKFPNTLIDMYSKCGSLDNALLVFQRMPWHSVVSWTVLILGYVDNGEEAHGLKLFFTMPPEQDGRAFLASVRACSLLAERESPIRVDGKLVKVETLEKGLEIHSRAEDSGFCDIYVGNALVDLYSKCNSVTDARRVFDRMPVLDVVSWTALILGYTDNGEPELALKLFSAMQRTNCSPNTLTFVAVFKACASLAVKETDEEDHKVKVLKKGIALHAQAAELGFETDMMVVNSLVSMYSSCGSMVNARSVFARAARPDTLLWTSLMLGYVENSQGGKALEIFATIRELAAPDTRTYAAAFKACGNCAALGACKAVHADTCRFFDVGGDTVLATCLMDSYCKSGSMVNAQLVFDSLSAAGTDSVTWTSLLGGYSRQGDMGAVFRLLQQMKSEQVEFSGVTFLCLLTACSHAGLVDKGRRLFKLMSSEHGVRPEVEHYVCMVDLLGRANKLEEALEMVNRMPFEPKGMAWMVLLGACYKWKNVSLGKVAFQRLQEIGESDSTVYELMSSIYRSALPD